MTTGTPHAARSTSPQSDAGSKSLAVKRRGTGATAHHLPRLTMPSPDEMQVRTHLHLARFQVGEFGQKSGAVDSRFRSGTRKNRGSTAPSGKKVKDQGVRVLATRKPSVSNRTRTWRLKRTAARTSSLSLRQEPPRTIRKLGSPPRSQADPSVGAPS